MVSSVMKRLNERRAAEFELEGSADAGFTLIELMVVLLILAILLAIAIPTFLGVTGGANDRAAQSNLNTALTTAKAAETQANQSYSTITAASLQANEPSITFVDSSAGGAPGLAASVVTTPGPVSVCVASGQRAQHYLRGLLWWPPRVGDHDSGSGVCLRRHHRERRRHCVVLEEHQQVLVRGRQHPAHCYRGGEWGLYG